MAYKKLVASIAGMALAVTAVVSAPAIAQPIDGDDDDTLLWMLTGTAAVLTLILVLGLGDDDEGDVPQPVSP